MRSKRKTAARYLIGRPPVCDQGRRGQLQNLASGPFGPGQPDDQFGGPAPDDAHVTGAIFRLNPDGTFPADNPFANVTAADMTSLEQQAGVTLTSAQLDNVAANVRKIFSYGRRNGFGLSITVRIVSSSDSW